MPSAIPHKIDDKSSRLTCPVGWWTKPKEQDRHQNGSWFLLSWAKNGHLDAEPHLVLLERWGNAAPSHPGTSMEAKRARARFKGDQLLGCSHATDTPLACCRRHLGTSLEWETLPLQGDAAPRPKSHNQARKAKATKPLLPLIIVSSGQGNSFILMWEFHA